MYAWWALVATLAELACVHAEERCNVIKNPTSLSNGPHAQKYIKNEMVTAPALTPSSSSVTIIIIVIHFHRHHHYIQYSYAALKLVAQLPPRLGTTSAARGFFYVAAAVVVVFSNSSTIKLMVWCRPHRVALALLCMQ